MKIEIMIYAYISICVSMILYNIIRIDFDEALQKQ